MKKLLIITLLLAGTATAETKLTFEEYNAINPNNQKPSIQMKARRKRHDESAPERMVPRVCFRQL